MLLDLPKPREIFVWSDDLGDSTQFVHTVREGDTAPVLSSERDEPSYCLGCNLSTRGRGRVESVAKAPCEVALGLRPHVRGSAAAIESDSGPAGRFPSNAII